MNGSDQELNIKIAKKKDIEGIVPDYCNDGNLAITLLNDIKNFSSKIHFDVFEKRIFLSLHEGLTYSANSFERVIAEAWYDIFGEEK